MKRYVLILTIALAGLVLILWIWRNPSPGRHANQPQILLPQYQTNPVVGVARKSRQSFAPSGSQPAPNTSSLAIPERLRPIIENWSEVPDYGLVQRLTKAELDVLVARYQQETNLLKLRSLTLALGLAQEERAIDLFKETLTTRFYGQPLASGSSNADSEEGIMHTTIMMLGLIAGKHDQAIEFLKQGLDPLFWKERAAWKTGDSADSYGVAAGDCIIAIASSGRPEVPEFLEQMKNQSLENTADPRVDIRRTDEGAVVDAAFWYDMVRQHGINFRLRRLTGQYPPDQFREWGKTTNGQQWRAWSKQRQRITW